jgi:hypothetical protein
MGVGHYDEPLPDRVDDIEEIRRADRFRFADRLSAAVTFGAGGRLARKSGLTDSDGVDFPGFLAARALGGRRFPSSRRGR